MPEFLTINRRALQDALLEWQQAERAGRAVPQAEADARRAQEVAEDGAHALWRLLERGPARQTGGR